MEHGFNYYKKNESFAFCEIYKNTNGSETGKYNIKRQKPNQERQKLYVLSYPHKLTHKKVTHVHTCSNVDKV